MATLTVGQDLDGWCIKCKLELAHVLVSLKASGLPHRVQCKTCGDVHAHRTQAPTKGRSKTSTPRITEYERLLRGRDVSKAAAYKISDTYSVEALIRHKTLGVGLVTGCKGDQKIEVLFPSGPKLLMCGRSTD